VDVEDGYYVFEESMRVVMEPPLLWRGRLTYLIGLGDPETLRIGMLGEMLGNPGRDALFVRIGPALAVSLTHHLEAVAASAFVIASPDDIGLAGGDLGQIGLRYRWATGDLWPEFP
jgi:hypothetical protein